MTDSGQLKKTFYSMSNITTLFCEQDWSLFTKTQEGDSTIIDYLLSKGCLD